MCYPRRRYTRYEFDVSLRAAVHRHVATLVVRYEDELELYCMPTRRPSFNEWEASWDVLLWEHASGNDVDKISAVSLSRLDTF